MCKACTARTVNNVLQRTEINSKQGESAMLSDHERFKNICSGFQSIVVGIAVLVGGAWTAFVFNAQLSVENAKVQVEKLHLELEQRPAINIDIDAQQLAIPDMNDKFLLITVLISNHGNSDTRLKWGTKPIKIESISFDKDGLEDRKHIASAGFTQVGHGVRVGDELKRSSVVKIPNDGLYRVTFQCPARTDQVTEIRASDNVYWFSSRYVVVK